MGKYRQRPVEVRAIQFQGDNPRAVEDFVGNAANYVAKGMVGETGLPTLRIRTIDSDMHIVKGDWVVELPSGQFATLDDHGFQTQYEEVSAS